MSGGVMRVAGYRFRATFRRRRGGYLAIVLLTGLVGGLAMGAIAGAPHAAVEAVVALALSSSPRCGVDGASSRC